MFCFIFATPPEFIRFKQQQISSGIGIYKEKNSHKQITKPLEFHFSEHVSQSFPCQGVPFDF